MLYAVLKIIARLAAKIYFRKIIINKADLLKEKGPLLLACSHPNSFLDAIVLDILFEKPIWSLTRGDVFLSARVARLFNKLKMLPVYRPSEGVENLSENYKTFETCIGLFRKNEIVLIFSEGLCVNEWHLRSLKKGTARLAYRCRQDDILLKILPVGINYSSYKRFGKNLFINFGNLVLVKEFDKELSDGNFNQAFNSWLNNELRQLVYEIPNKDRRKQKELLEIKISIQKKGLLFFPAIIGFIIHAPLYLPIKAWVQKKYSNDIHVDSMQFALSVVFYPFYLGLIFFLSYLINQSIVSLLVFLILPFTAWSYVQLKNQFDD